MAQSSQGKLIFPERLTNFVNKRDEPQNESPCPWIKSWRKPGASEEDVAKLSEEKGRRLFESEEAKLAWIVAVKKSVEQSIQTKVRAALGTPPCERRKKLHRVRQEEDARRRKIELEALMEQREKEALSETLSFRTRFEENIKLDFETRRQQFLRTQKMYKAKGFARCPNDAAQSTEVEYDKDYLDPLSKSYGKNFGHYTRAALENLGSVRQEPVYVRAVGTVWIDHTGKEHELEGPFWPKDHLPKYPNQNHIQTIPEFVEPLNTPAENRNVQIKSECALYPRPWRGSLVMYYRQSKGNILQDVPRGCAPNLQFESRFECGNLRQAKRIGSYEYDLVLNTDLYTKRHTQWYYFRVQQMVPGVTYKFNIINFRKKDSLYNYGMQPLFYSEKRAQSSNGCGWSRVGHHINYGRNLINKNILLSRDQAYYTLTFQLEFPYDDDVCYLAHCYPYSYTDLEIYLRTLEDSPLTAQHCKNEVLCKTLAGNNCYQLTVTSPDVPGDRKLGVVVSARVHPGETNASWMMKGLIDFLTSHDPVAETLRQKFVFKIIPMLNPDGVIVGNYRTNLAGRDLNRTYKNPKKVFYPTTWHTKNLIENFSKEHEVVFYCDLHGHSRKPNVFMYGCTADNNMLSMNNFLQERLFAWLLSQKAPDKFSFSGCKFKVHKRKESTARVVMWRQLGIKNSFTMEATFCGANFGDMDKGRHFNTADFEAMGKNFGEVLLEYSEAQGTDKSEVTQAFVELACKMTRDILRQTLGTFRNLTSENCCNNTALTFNEEERCNGKNSKRWKRRNRQKEANKRVNFVDVELHPRQVESSGFGDDGLELSVRSVHVDSFNDCIKILESLNLADCYSESESSDSDSEAEGDDASDTKSTTASDKNYESRKKKKKRKKRKVWWETLSKPLDDKKPEKEVEESDKKQNKVKVNFPKFHNPYTDRHNGGIPIFSQERVMERAKKKEMLEKEADDERRGVLFKYSEDDPCECYPLLAFTDNTELNFVTAQRRLACYMLAKTNAGATSGNIRNGRTQGGHSAPKKYSPRQERPVGLDSFKFDHLSGGGYGFTIRIPGRDHAKKVTLPGRTRNDNKSLKDGNCLTQSLPSVEEPQRMLGARGTVISSASSNVLDSNGRMKRSVISSNEEETSHPVCELYADMLEYQDFGEGSPENGAQSEPATKTKSRKLRHSRYAGNESIVFENYLEDNKDPPCDYRLPRQHRPGNQLQGNGLQQCNNDHSPEFVPTVIPSYSHLSSSRERNNSTDTKRSNYRS